MNMHVQLVNNLQLSVILLNVNSRMRSAISTQSYC